MRVFGENARSSDNFVAGGGYLNTGRLGFIKSTANPADT